MASPSLDRRLGLTGNKAYKAPCDVATTTNITLSGEQTIDGVVTSGSRVLVWNQTNAVDNGIWDSSTGSWSRAIDCNTNQDLAKGTQVYVSGGTAYAGNRFVFNSSNPIQPGTSSITITQSTDSSTLQTRLADPTSASNGAGMVAYSHTPASGYAAQTLYSKLRADLVCLDDFFIAGDSDWYNASRRAAIYCATTGATLRLRPKVYDGARLEVHKTFSIEGNGATIKYLGIGNTYIAGTGSGTSAVPTPWEIVDPDAMTELYPVTMYTPSGSSAIGDTSMSFASVTGISAGDYLFIAANPSSSSSPTNYIPRDFEYARVKSIVGLAVTFWGRLKNAYTTAAAAFKCDGLAVNCYVENLRITTTDDAYQHVIRSALNLKLVNIEFAGESAVGGCTFSQNIRWIGCNTVSSYGPITTARGTVSASIDGYEWVPRTNTPIPEPLAVFVEESCYLITIRDLKADGGYFLIGSMDMGTSAQGKRLITVSDSTIDTTNAPGALADRHGPFRMGTCTGVDVTLSNCTLAGTAVTPNASNFPGITGLALTWASSTQVNDKLKFLGCHFKSTNAQPVFPTAASGLLGTVIFDSACTYETITPPLSKYTPRGAWVDMTSGLQSPYTVTSASPAQVFRYRVTNDSKQVVLSGRITLNGATAGSLIFTMPTALFPAREHKFAIATDVTGFSGSTIAIVRINASGNIFLVGCTGAAPTYIDFSGFSYPLDID